MRGRKERPHLPDKILDGISTHAEDFQNKVLRPIIKAQSELLIVHLHAKLAELKIDLSQLNEAKQQKALTQLLTNNQSFKKEIIGMVVGQFTVDEYELYVTIKKEINRRITQIVLNRYLDLVL